MILYVEDNPANIKLVETILSTRPATSLISAPTAETGLTIARSYRPHLILLDINLPGMDGLEALAHLKELEELTGVPVVAISAHAMPHDVQKALDAGFDDYLTKPVDMQQLLETVDAHLVRD